METISTNLPIPATVTTADHEASARRRPVVLGGILGAGAALAADLTIYAIGNLGAPVRVVTGWAPEGADLSVAEVGATAVVAVGLGAVALSVLTRSARRGFRIWAGIAAAIAVLSSVPLFGLDVDTGSKLTLAAMHLATGACAVAAQAVVRRASHR